MSDLTLGIDLSKDPLEAHLALTGETRGFPKSKAGFTKSFTHCDGFCFRQVFREMGALVLSFIHRFPVEGQAKS